MNLSHFISFCLTVIELEELDQTPEVTKRKSKLNVHCLPIVVVNHIGAPTKDPRKVLIEIQARDPKSGRLRKYLWRVESPQRCRFWMQGLTDHRNHLLAMLRWVSLNKHAAVQVDWH